MLAANQVGQLRRGADDVRRVAHRPIVHEADDAIGVVVLRGDEVGHAACGRTGAEDEDALLEVRVTRDAVEREAPRRNRDQQQAEGGEDGRRCR